MINKVLLFCSIKNGTAESVESLRSWLYHLRIVNRNFRQPLGPWLASGGGRLIFTGSHNLTRERSRAAQTEWVKKRNDAPTHKKHGAGRGPERWPLPRERERGAADRADQRTTKWSDLVFFPFTHILVSLSAASKERKNYNSCQIWGNIGRS